MLIGLVAARLKPCPAQNPLESKFFRSQQRLKPVTIFSGLAACLKAYPDTKPEFFRKL
jgi:hypothetical protein